MKDIIFDTALGDIIFYLICNRFCTSGQSRDGYASLTPSVKLVCADIELCFSLFYVWKTTGSSSWFARVPTAVTYTLIPFLVLPITRYLFRSNAKRIHDLYERYQTEMEIILRGCEYEIWYKDLHPEYQTLGQDPSMEAMRKHVDTILYLCSDMAPVVLHNRKQDEA